MFEWCSVQQQIVVGYEEDKLWLIAMRHNITGEFAKLRIFYFEVVVLIQPMHQATTFFTKIWRSSLLRQEFRA